MSIELCSFRTARRLAHAGWTIYCRETGEGWYFGTTASERRIRRILKLALCGDEDFLWQIILSPQKWKNGSNPVFFFAHIGCNTSKVNIDTH